VALVVVRIRLLGRPAVERDGRPAAPRGRKAWAMLAAGIDNPALAPLLDGHHRQGARRVAGSYGSRSDQV